MALAAEQARQEQEAKAERTVDSMDMSSDDEDNSDVDQSLDALPSVSITSISHTGRVRQSKRRFRVLED